MKGMAAVLYGVEWGVTVKVLLIVAVCAVLAAVLTLLALEIIGKRKAVVLHAAASESDDYAVDEAKEPIAETVSEVLEEEDLLEEESSATEDFEEDEEETELADEAVLVDDSADGESGIMILGEKHLKVRYDRSFVAKLIQSDDVFKGRYSEITNELLNFGLKPRMSWSSESFGFGRGTYARLAVRGKTLSLYLAIAPEKLAGTKYNFKDVSAVVKYRDVPVHFKLSSDRSVRWAKELIAFLAAENSLLRIERAEENFRPDYRDTASLVRDGYIKLRYVCEGDFDESEKYDAALRDIKLRDKAPRDFMTKLMRGDRNLKERYSMVKNELLRYGLKPRISMSGESWFSGRTAYAKFVIRGKTLSVYLALDPDDFDAERYRFRDVGEIAKYENIPMYIRLKSDRSTNRVKELIAALAQKENFLRTDRAEEDFRYVDLSKKK